MGKTILILLSTFALVVGSAVASTVVPKTGAWKGQTAGTTFTFSIAKQGKTEKVTSIEAGTFRLSCGTKPLFSLLNVATTKVLANGSFKVVQKFNGGSATVTGRFTGKTKATGSIVVDIAGLCKSSYPWSASR